MIEPSRDTPPPTAAAVGPEATAAAVGPEARLLAEAVRLLEQTRGAVFDAPAAETAARAGGGGFEARICARAAALPVAAEMAEALGRVRGAIRLAIAVALAAGAVAGATTARVALDASPVNVYWALLSLLGVQVLALAGWLLFAVMRGGPAATGAIGGAVLGLGRRFAAWGKRGAVDAARGKPDAVDAAAARAVAAMLSEGGMARAVLGGISHGVWLAFLVAALIVVIVRLATLDFVFVWETTILAPPDYIALTRGLAALPEALGFATPSVDEIAASRRLGADSPASTARAGWSGFIIGCLVAYGLLPRAVVLVVCLIGWRRARARWRLDTAHVGYAVLRPRLLPTARTDGIVDPAPPPPPSAAPPGAWPTPDPPPPEHAGLPAAPVFAGDGPLGIVGLEIEAPAAGWPPPLPGVDWRDLGLADDRGGRHRAIAAARAALPPPRGVLVVCDLAATPDRGAGVWIRTLGDQVSAPVGLLLTGGDRLRRRARQATVDQRIADWHRLAATAGIANHRVVDADLDHLTDTAAERLARALGVGNGDPVAGPALAAAFARIVEHAGRWRGPPSDRERADLQLAIARLSRTGSRGWLARLGLPDRPEPPSLESLRDGANHLVDLLPARLRTSPRWLAAGAAAGALGCVAAALLAASAAIAALPAWAGLGAAIAIAVRPLADSLTASGAADAAGAEPERDMGEAVAAAALFALVLHLQGRPEGTITRLLDHVLPDASPPALADAAAAAAWLDGIDQRLAAALAVDPGVPETGE